MRFILMLMMAFVLVLSACSGTSSDEEKSKQGSNDTQSSHKADNGGKNGREDEKGDHNNEQDNQKNKQDEKKEDESKNVFKQKKPEYEMTENYYIKPIGDADPKVVLLTIDDAPEEHAVEMAKTLKKLDAPAIFYINKIYVDKDGGKEKLKKLHDMGFALGNHTVTHPNLSDLSEKEQREEVVPVYDQIKKITGEDVKFFRAPHGVNTDASNEEAKKRDVMVMNWSYGYDFMADYEDAEKLKKIMLHPDPEGLLHDGAILLMHDRDWTNEALEDIVRGLRDKGYKIIDPALLKTPQSPE